MADSLSAPNGDLSAIDSALDSHSGVSLQAQGLSWKALVAAMSYSVAAHVAQLICFFLLRRRFKQIYQPRTSLVPEREIIAEPPGGLISWLKAMCTTPDEVVILKCGLDAFFFLRYLRMLITIFLPLAIILLPTLLPINRLSGRISSATGLDVLSISNISPEFTKSRLWIHLSMAILVVVWVCYVIYRELLYYVRIKQETMARPQYKFRTSSSSILVTGIPSKWLSESWLKEIYGIFPGGVKHVCINRELNVLSAKIKIRNDVLERLEVEETRLIRMVVKQIMAQNRTEKSPHGSDNPRHEPTTALQHDSNVKRVGRVRQHEATSLKDAVSAREALEHFLRKSEQESAVWRKHISPAERSSTRLPVLDSTLCPSIPFIGTKVDLIYYLRHRLMLLNNEIQDDQEEATRNSVLLRSAFVQFNEQIAAHLACQSVSHKDAYHMTPHLVESGPGDVIWDNLSSKWWQHYLRCAVVFGASSVVTIFYAIPVAFTSVLANIDELAAQVSWLAWLSEWPDSVKSILQGVLPPALLQLLLMLVPMVYRHLVTFQGVTTGTARELGVQTWYFLFLFTQIFLVLSISGGLLDFVFTAAKSPAGIATQLARSMPKAANYFFSFLMMRALSDSAGALLQIGALAWSFLGPFHDCTARQKWRRQNRLCTVKWGSFWPPFTNFAVIGLAYSVTAPLVLGFTVFMFALFWIVYRYNVLFVYHVEHDTKGRLFPAAVHQLFTGVYVLEICLTGFFFISEDSDGHASCIPQGIIMMALLLLTVLYQVILKTTFGPLINYIPITLHATATSEDIASSRGQDVQKEGEIHAGSGPMERGYIADNPASRGVEACIDDNSEDLSLESGHHNQVNGFEHPALCHQKPIIWLPRDDFGVSDSEVHNVSEYLDISNERCELEGTDVVVAKGIPPDHDGLHGV